MIKNNLNKSKNKFFTIVLSVIFTTLFVFLAVKASYLDSSGLYSGGDSEIWGRLKIGRGVTGLDLKSLKVVDNSGNEKFSVDASGNGYFNGNVGIGTNDPAFKLHVDEGTIYATNTTYDVGIYMTPGVGNYGLIQAVNEANVTPKDLVLQYYGGNVGIGTTSPGRIFQVNSASLPVVSLMLSGTEKGTFGIAGATGDWFTGTAVGDTTVRSETTDLWVGTYNASLPVRFVTANTQRMIIDGSGNVGIGITTDLAEKLTVNGNVAANAFYYNSDINLKHNIQPLSSSLDKLLQLQGVSFEWNDDSKSAIGLIAQDVEKVFPELVTTNKSTNMKSVEYGNLVAPIIEAIKEQQAKIKEQEAKINLLESEIEKLKNLKQE